jgi:NAD(P)-dependent dehydrogenase (short-subunit alcohol dehydrogenase family)
MLDLRGRVAIVTGSSGGIGRAVAWELAARGARVVLNGRRADRLQAAERELAAEGAAVLAVQADVLSPEDSDALVRRTLEAFGRLDILVANVGISMRGSFEEIAPEVFRRTMDQNVLASVYPVRASLAELRRTRGSIVFVSSAAGIRGLPWISAYSAAKMALTALAESLRMELHGSGIHVGIVYVGLTENDPDKLILGADGGLIPLARRDSRVVQTRQQVARGIVRAIRKRRFKTVLSAMGKLNAVATRLAPRISERIILAYLKRNRGFYQ